MSARKVAKKHHRVARRAAHDERGWQHSGVIPIRWKDGEVEVLLITSRKHGKWVIPKGRVPGRHGPRASALREAYQEAGIEGRLQSKALGWYVHGKRKDAPRVRVYVMEVEREHDVWPEQHERARRWAPIEEARAIVGQDGVRTLLEWLATRLEINPRP